MILPTKSLTPISRCKNCREAIYFLFGGWYHDSSDNYLCNSKGWQKGSCLAEHGEARIGFRYA